MKLSLKKTLVLGASENALRYSNMAIRKLSQHKIETVAIGNKSGDVEGVKIEKEQFPFENIHTITLYLNPKNQEQYKEYILSLKPERVIFNPGTENSVFEKELIAKGIDAIEACTLVMLSTDQF